jgi:hypothetical protein
MKLSICNPPPPVVASQMAAHSSPISTTPPNFKILEITLLVNTRGLWALQLTSGEGRWRKSNETRRLVKAAALFSAPKAKTFQDRGGFELKNYKARLCASGAPGFCKPRYATSWKPRERRVPAKPRGARL